ncbi:Crp/Fnr family transcriptional regulator [Altererythrobacter sp. KTW20L]|uniref:Crp/Fnr family transcriptional regulator n=1 Tax=Altererythrobacter sp. KTW20L TaxID=2942210 RepID=UPI0020BE9884|nr:Crp/Fnr family transcriptional regulator [Altererythrobacter sp. KTW20L]MCL6250833.1 Crp/Fnr family transcriptional regulator [Altererythrobacter sp. KTW20L]
MANRFVQKLSGLADLDADDAAALERVTAKPRRYVARQDLIREGDEPGPMFVVLEGWVCRYKILPSGSRQIMAFLMPGDACDLHIKLLAQMDHGIQAITTASVATVSREQMESMMRDHPNIARTMYMAQLVDEGIMRAWIVSMGRRSAAERVAHLICELYLRARSIGLTGEGEFALPLSQLVLADALGMTAVHINRVLKELRLAGAMALTRGSVTILDPVKLVQIAGFDENYLHRRLLLTGLSAR